MTETPATQPTPSKSQKGQQRHLVDNPDDDVKILENEPPINPSLTMVVIGEHKKLISISQVASPMNQERVDAALEAADFFTFVKVARKGVPLI